MSRVALISGASSGIGEELAKELARRGWRLGLMARRTERLEEIAAAIVEAGGAALPLSADVTDRAGVGRAVDSVIHRWGRIDLAVANAGLSNPSSVAHFDRGAAIEILRINFEGMLNLADAVLPAMVARGDGHFAGVASLAGWKGLPGGGIYSASKSAMQTWLEAARVELRPRGIAVTTVNPGFIRTPMTAKNRFPMPFLMNADAAAKRIADALEAKRRVLSFPRRMAFLMRLIQLTPDALYERASLPYAKAKARSVPDDSREA